MMEGYTLLGVLVIINIISIGLTLTLTQWLGSKSIEAVSQADVELFIFVFVNLSNACIIAMLGGKTFIPTSFLFPQRFIHVKLIEDLFFSRESR